MLAYHVRSLTPLLAGMLAAVPLALSAATLTVNTLNDSTNVPGQCSLRDAVTHANADAKVFPNSSCPAGDGHDTIVFAVSGTITLEAALTVTSPITVQGPIILSGGTATRAFSLTVAGDLTLIDLTVRDGRAATGGAIDANNGQLRLWNVDLVNNAATGSDGGAIRAGQSLSLIGGRVTGNQAMERGGAILFTAPAPHHLHVSGTRFDANRAGQRGGVIAVAGNGDLLIQDAVFAGNLAEGTQNSHGGGALFIDNGRDDSLSRIERSEFLGNLSLRGSGGAIYLANDGPFRLDDSWLAGNSSGGPLFEGRGGAIFSQNGRLDIRASGLAGNRTASNGTGGALHQAGGAAILSLSNSSLYDNQAPSGQGGALRIGAGQAQLRNVTLAGNTAATGSAISNGATVQVWNSILSGSDPVCAGTAPQNLGNNLQHPGSSCGGGLASADPRLDPADFNGGPLSSMRSLALRPDSPALDAGSSTICTADPVANRDQRGQPRPVDGNGSGTAICDVGAFESSRRRAGFGSTPVRPGPLRIGPTTPGVPASSSLRVFETGNADLILSDPLISGPQGASFTLGTSFPITITDGGASASIEVTCLSNSTGTRNGSLSLLTNDPDQPQLSFDLRCTVTASPSAGFASVPIAPGPLDFGSTQPGVPVDLDFQLINQGGATLNLGQASLNGAHAADFNIVFIPASVPPGPTPIDANLRCTPGGMGLRQARLNIPTNDPSEPQITFNLACRGAAPDQEPLSSPGQSLQHASGQPLNGANGIAISPDGRHVYAAATTASSIAIFARNPDTGLLSPLSPLTAFGLVGVTSLGISPDGQQLYATRAAVDSSPAAFLVLQRNPASGALSIASSFRNGTELSNFTAPTGIAVAPDGRHIYVASGGSNAVFSFQRAADGALSFLSSTTSATNLAGVAQLAISTDGNYLYATASTSATNGRLTTYQRNPQTGGLSFRQTLVHNQVQAWPGCPVISVLGLAGAGGIALSPDERHLYATGSGSNAIARFRRSSDGTLCYLGRVQDGLAGAVGLQGANDLSLSPDGGFLYAAAGNSNAVTAFARDPSSGALSQRMFIVPNAAGLPRLVGARQMVLSPDGRSLHITASQNNALVTLPVANPVPVVESLSPASATEGQAEASLRVRGQGFVPGSQVRVNGVARSTEYISADELRTTLPGNDLNAAGTRNISVISPQPGGGTSSPALTFTVRSAGQNPTPTILALEPQARPAGSDDFTLVVRGSQFINGATVRWNGINRAASFVNDRELRATITATLLVPPGPAAVLVVNPGPGGGSSNTLPFVLAAPGQNLVPTITGLIPDRIVARGPNSRGRALVIQGAGFVPSSTARWNDQDRPTIYVSPTELRMQLSAADGSETGWASVKVVNPAPGGGPSLPYLLRLSPLGDLIFQDRLQAP